MAFLKKLRNREGKIYYYIGENYREGNKVRFRKIQYIGRDDIMLKDFDNPLSEAQRQLDVYKESHKKPIVITKSEIVGECRNNPSLNIGINVLQSFYNSLNITKHLNLYDKQHKYNYSLDEVMRLLVFGRILDPKSKSKTVEKFQKTLWGNWNISQNDMDRALDHLDTFKEDVQFLIHKSVSKSIGRTATLVFYDVTNYYFETDKVDGNEGLRNPGYSKENQKTAIVQMGLFMDSNGIPIAYKLFKGNQTDPITYMPAVEQVKRQFGIKRIVTVADKAMNSTKNISDAISKGDGYLFSSKFRGQKGSRKDLQKFILDESGWEYSQDLSFAKKSIILTRKLSNSEIIEEKVVVTWKKKYAIREKIRRDGAISYVENMRPSQMKRVLIGKNEAKYYNVTMKDENGNEVKLNPLIHIDQNKVAFDEQFDGMNVITTSEINMTDDEIIKAYGQLYKIEDCFRVTKTDLKTRPVFVWTTAHIEAHFLTCFIAVVIVKLMHHKLNGKYSVSRIVGALNSMSAKFFESGYWETEASGDAVEILETFNVDWRANIKTKKEIENLAKI